MIVLENSDDYLVQYYNEGNQKLMVCIHHTLQPGKHELNLNKKDFYTKQILSASYDVIHIRSKQLENMYDADITETFNKIIEITKKYNLVEGFFMCGGNVLGLYFSKLIDYKTIYCHSPRFLKGFTMTEKPEFDYTNYKVTEEHLNKNAFYFIINDDSDYYDFETKTWLANRVKPHMHVQYHGSQRAHLLTEMFNLKDLKEFLKCLFRKELYRHEFLSYYINYPNGTIHHV